MSFEFYFSGVAKNYIFFFCDMTSCQFVIGPNALRQIPEYVYVIQFEPVNAHNFIKSQYYNIPTPTCGPE